jgi:predicted nuclease of predicted toxin-antitoxin system
VRARIDENLPDELGPALTALGHDTDSVYSEGLQGRADPDVWTAAQRDERLLITQDLGFSDVRQFAPGTHRGLILLRLLQPSRRELVDRLVQVFQNEDAASWSRCFVVVTDKKVRVRRP